MSTAIESDVESGKVSKMVAKRKDAGEVAVSHVASESAAIIAMIERAARDPAVDIDKMQRLFLMSVEAKANAARTEFLAAFAKLQKDLPAVERKGTGHNSKKYARFEDFIETVKGPLAAHGFSLSFRINQIGVAVKDGGPIEPSGIRITGVLGHEAGHQEDTSLTLPADKTGNKNDVQALGSTISYGKRYVGMTLLGIATEDEDDDGKAAGKGETITEEQAAALKKLMTRASVEDQIIFEWGNVKALTELTPAQLKLATAKCNKKIELSA